MNAADRHLRAAERRRADALVQRERAEAKRLRGGRSGAAAQRGRGRGAPRQPAALAGSAPAETGGARRAGGERDRRRRDAVERKRRAVGESAGTRRGARGLEQQRRGMILAKRFRADRVALLLARVVRVWGSYAAAARTDAPGRPTGRRLRERFLRAAPFRRWAAFTRNARRSGRAFAQERLLMKPFRAWAAWSRPRERRCCAWRRSMSSGAFRKRGRSGCGRRSFTTAVEYDNLQAQLRRDRVNEAKAERHDERRLAAKAWRAWVVSMAARRRSPRSNGGRRSRRRPVKAPGRGRGASRAAAANYTRAAGAKDARGAEPRRPTLDEGTSSARRRGGSLAERTNARLAERRQREEAAAPRAP